MLVTVILQFHNTHSLNVECDDEGIRLRSVENNNEYLDYNEEIGSGSLRSGRVNRCVRGSWAPICPVGWSFSNAAVVCSQLGYSRNGQQVYSSLYMNRVTVPMFLYFRCCAYLF